MQSNSEGGTKTNWDRKLSIRQKKKERKSSIPGIWSLVGGEKPSTKAALAALRGISERPNLLVVIERSNDVAALSVRNLVEVHTLYVDQLNTYDVLVSDDVIFTKAAYDAFVGSAQADTEAAAGITTEEDAK